MTALDVFDDVAPAKPLLAHYRVRLQVKELIVGGIPGRESVMRDWIRARMDLDDTALNELVAQVVRERDVPLSAEAKVDAVMESALRPSVNGFLRDDNGQLCYPGRCMKAAIKEFANSAYPGTVWPRPANDPTIPARKGLMNTLAERVFVVEHLIGLGVKEPSGVEERVKHPMTPQGKVSLISIVEVVERPVLEFTLRVDDDFLPREAWQRIWVRGEGIGIGADRGRSDGQFELLAFDRL